MRSFELFYDDLHSHAQHRLCSALHTTPEENNWDVFPIAIIESNTDENDEEEPKNLASDNDPEKGRQT